MDRQTAPKRNSGPSAGFLHWSILSRSSFPHASYTGSSYRQKKQQNKMHEIMWWNHALPVLMHQSSGEYCTSQWYKGENKNKCLQASMNCLSKKKRDWKGKKSTNCFFFLLMWTLKYFVWQRFKNFRFWGCFSWAHCQLWWGFVLFFWFCFRFVFFIFNYNVILIQPHKSHH